MPLIGCTAVFNKGADGEGHFEVYTKLNKIKILFNLGERKMGSSPEIAGFRRIQTAVKIGTPQAAHVGLSYTSA